MIELSRFCFSKFSKNRNVRMCFGIVCVFCIINWYVEYDIRILCLFLYIWSWNKWDFLKNKNVPEVWTTFVRTIWGILGPKWSPWISLFVLDLLALVSKMCRIFQPSILRNFQHHVCNGLGLELVSNLASRFNFASICCGLLMISWTLRSANCMVF